MRVSVAESASVSHTLIVFSDKRLGQLTIQLKNPQCFEAEFYAIDMNVDAPEDRRLNFGDCMVRGLLGRWAQGIGIKLMGENDPVDVWGSGWVDRKKKRIPKFRFWDNPQARGKHPVNLKTQLYAVKIPWLLTDVC